MRIAQDANLEGRYQFIIYNASIVYWDICRPICRLTGWQSKVLQETGQVGDEDIDFDGAGDEQDGQDHGIVGQIRMAQIFQPEPHKTVTEDGEVERCAPLRNPFGSDLEGDFFPWPINPSPLIRSTSS